MKLIPNAKKWYRMISVQCQGVAIAALGSWQALDPDWKAAIPFWVVMTVAISVLVLGIFGRLVQQDSVSGKPTK